MSSTRRLVDHHRLEAPLERRILLDVLAVLVERGRADAVQLAAREHRLEHVAGVHRALGRAGADDGVQLVDEEQDPALGGLDLLQHGLEALLELAAVLRARDERAHVEREDRLVAQALRHVAAHDALREALDDGRLADARVADQHRVVLGLAREDLDRRGGSPRRGRSPGRACRCAPPRRGRGRTSRAPRRPSPASRSSRAGCRAPRVRTSRKRSRVDAVLATAAARRRLPARGEHGQHDVLDRDVLVLEALAPPARAASSTCASARVTCAPRPRGPGPAHARAALEHALERRRCSAAGVDVRRAPAVAGTRPSG